jgi:hypothetical protein
VTRAVIGTVLCVPTASMAEGKRFNVLFQRHLQEEFRRASLVVVLLGGSLGCVSFHVVSLVVMMVIYQILFFLNVKCAKYALEK